jgi:hypothetical protein
VARRAYHSFFRNHTLTSHSGTPSHTTTRTQAPTGAVVTRRLRAHRGPHLSTTTVAAAKNLSPNQAVDGCSSPTRTFLHTISAVPTPAIFSTIRKASPRSFFGLCAFPRPRELLARQTRQQAGRWALWILPAFTTRLPLQQPPVPVLDSSSSTHHHARPL